MPSCQCSPKPEKTKGNQLSSRQLTEDDLIYLSVTRLQCANKDRDTDTQASGNCLNLNWFKKTLLPLRQHWLRVHPAWRTDKAKRGETWICIHREGNWLELLISVYPFPRWEGSLFPSWAWSQISGPIFSFALSRMTSAGLLKVIRLFNRSTQWWSIQSNISLGVAHHIELLLLIGLDYYSGTGVVN